MGGKARYIFPPMKEFLLKKYKWMIALAAVLAAGYLTFLYPSIGGLTQSPKESLTEENLSFRSGDLEHLRILYKAIFLVQQQYIDASRIDPKRMLDGALKEIQRVVPEVMIKEDSKKSAIDIQVNEEKKTFDVSDVTSPPSLLSRFKDMFRFIRSSLRDEDVDFNEVQYEAINGMLQTLDPHTVLINPRDYRQMKVETAGEFGGLGIVISIRDGQLTIISPIEGTPAAKVGLKSMDRIVMIGEASTINMALDKAVSLLRGPPGTRITIWVLRKGWTEPKPFAIERAVIHVESVESAMLSGRVGYVHIKTFQGNTASDLKTHLEKLHREGMSGLVLDLRGNPGGLLDSAVDVSDFFIEKGPIVTTAGRNPAERYVQEAQKEGTEPPYPLVCLVNGGSASASEIVSGAIQGTGRGLVVGEPTFGKGSVQKLWEFDDGSALKITIGQYLTPGDVSIQTVGVQPDVRTRPVVITRRNVDLEEDQQQQKEKTLSDHLERAGQKEAQRPHEEVAYLYTPPSSPRTDAGQDEADGGTDGEDDNSAEEDMGLTAVKLKKDFEAQLGLKLVEHAESTRTPLRLDSVKALLDQVRLSEVSRMTEEFAKIGVDWSAGESAGPSDLEARLEMVEGNEIRAGSTCHLKATVINHGPGTVYRLRASSFSDNELFQDKEFVFGKIAPGETRTFEVAVKIHAGAWSRVDDVGLSFFELHGRLPRLAPLRVTMKQIERPRFSVSFNIIDRPSGNGDGLLQKGETVRFPVGICNQGSHASLGTQALLVNLSDQSLFIRNGRADLGKLQPGQCGHAIFEFDVRAGLDAPELRVELDVMDQDLGEMFRKDIRMHTSPEGAGFAPGEGAVSAPEGMSLLERPDKDSKPIGVAGKQASFRILGSLGDFWLVALDESGGLSAFVEKAKTASWSGKPTLAWQWPKGHSAPEVALSIPIPEVTRSAEITISGRATDDQEIREVFLFAGDEYNWPTDLYRDKVYYTTHPKGENLQSLPFSAKVPLELGSNIVTLVARHGGLEETRLFYVIRRDDPQGKSYMSPRLGQKFPLPIEDYPLISPDQDQSGR